MPADKGAHLFQQSHEEPCNDLFDQYLSFDTVNPDGSISLTTSEPALLVMEMKEIDSVGTSPNLKGDKETQPNISQPSLCEPRKPALQLSAATGNLPMSEEPGRTARDVELLSLDGISLHSPRIKSSSSPNMLVAGTKLGSLEGPCKSLKSETTHHTLYRASPIRKVTSLSKMVHRLQHPQQTMYEFGHRPPMNAAKFNLGLQHNLRPLSPPLSAQLSGLSNDGNHPPAASQQHNINYLWDPSFSPQYARPADLDSPLTTPPSDITTFHSNHHHESCNNTVYTTIHRNQCSTSWGPSPYPSEYNFQTPTTYFPGPESTMWAGADAAQTAFAEPIPGSAGHPRAKQGNDKQVVRPVQAESAGDTNELPMSAPSMPSGLWISMPNSPTRKPFIMEPSPTSADHQGFRYPQVPPSASASSGQPVRHTQLQPQSVPKNYAPLRQEKSCHTLAESPLLSSPSCRASSFHISKKRSFHRKRAEQQQQQQQQQAFLNGAHHHTHHAKIKSSKAASHGNSTGTVVVADFVNFTPDDSMRILTGVAPSGSSKTKARREKEAAEKTRRLSQAAIKAVRAVGGSIEGLVEEGIFVPTEN